MATLGGRQRRHNAPAPGPHLGGLGGHAVLLLVGADFLLQLGILRLDAPLLADKLERSGKHVASATPPRRARLAPQP